MSDIGVFYLYVSKFFISIKAMLSNPVGVTLMIPTVAVPAVTSPGIEDAYRALIVLGILFSVDFITGIMAAYTEFKKALKVTPATGKIYVIQSSLWRKSVVKFIFYGLAALVARGMEWAFMAKPFEPSENLNKMTLTTIVIFFCCCIEFYSIFFENIKRMGFDVVEWVVKITSKGHSVYKKIKNENESS